MWDFVLNNLLRPVWDARALSVKRTAKYLYNKIQCKLDANVKTCGQNIFCKLRGQQRTGGTEKKEGSLVGVKKVRMNCLIMKERDRSGLCTDFKGYRNSNFTTVMVRSLES